jgi:hypothetical protein
MQVGLDAEFQLYFQHGQLDHSGEFAGCANLNWLGGKPTTICLTFTSSTANNDVTIQYSLDDLQRVTSTGVVWASLSSAGITANATSPFHFASTTWSDNAFTAQILSPLAAVRMASTAFGGGTATLKVAQGEGW